ncbi:MAG: hypothetical protein RI950_957 [Bacteroidota bacterium]|jgi:hypothetical protein
MAFSGIDRSCQYAKKPFSTLKVFQPISALGTPQGTFGLSDAVATKSRSDDP